MENLNESLNENLTNENENLTELFDEEIKYVTAKTTELIPLLALAPLLISGIAAAATTEGVIADKVLRG